MRISSLFGKKAPSASVRVPRHQVRRSHPDRHDEVLRAIKQTIAEHGVDELMATERVIWNVAEALHFYMPTPENDFGRGHRIEHWASAIYGFERMGLPEVADITLQTMRIKSAQAKLSRDDGAGQDGIVMQLHEQTSRFYDIEQVTDFSALKRKLIDDTYPWA